MKALYFATFLMTAAPAATAQETADAWEISLLTADPGEALYSTFGHSALRVQNKREGLDLVFDYGVFDFETPNFLGKFMRGSLPYQLGVRPFEGYIRAYREEGRAVIEEGLNLPPDDKARLYAQLRENYRPENRFYYYDFLFDNCSTRIRDLLTDLPSVVPPPGLHDPTEATFRDNLHPYLLPRPWLKLGTDLVLGMPVDERMTPAEEMFLPTKLSENLRRYRVDGGRSLLAPPVVLPAGSSPEGGAGQGAPVLVLAVVVLLLGGLMVQYPRVRALLLPLVYIVLSLGGLLLLFLWLGTTHGGTRWNWNVLWLHPLYLLLLLPGRRWRRYVWGLIALGLLGCLLFWVTGVQYFHPAVAPLMLGLLALAVWEGLGHAIYREDGQKA